MNNDTIEIWIVIMTNCAIEIWVVVVIVALAVNGVSALIDMGVFGTMAEILCLPVLP
jgi:hypothetical protein